ncbi:xylan 1,4-beta-xylosidase [Algoriphagus iocasae]|uniref:Xylan 1,4-beta-xylosidase n=1 Tax=Algoriphagus iocasae TaxID=1836499 RepID=A0A841MRT6_9BACT|nr:beta-xylosidase [Algoriphagus iocasae]MBB6325328.1 xylan 1,4-beta-xylosidase [Algoriphagus iocasae]
MKPLLIKTLLTFLVFSFTIIHLKAQEQVEKVNIQVNLDKKIGEMDPIWAWWGYDEPNYTYMKDGKKLLSEIASLSPVPVYVRAHSLLVTGEGTHALKWGSTNAYTEDSDGNPVYDWTIVDRIFDTYIERGMKPFAQIGFMPEALSSKPEPYRHHWYPGAPYEEIYTGWAYPPNDYEKYGELVYQWVLHCVDRYGKEEVDSWYWEVWNEPNIGYWQGTMEEYFMLYDYAADAVKRALPSAKIGGPETTGPGWDKAAEFLTAFLDHVRDDNSYATGKKDIPLDFISFHAKGSPKLVDDMVQMNIGTQLRDISEGFRIVASYPEFKDLPIIIGESDPEGCAACSVNDYPQNDYRNGTMYASYTAAAFSRKYELADHFGVNLLGAVTWGFEFEDQPWYAGFRDMATNGVDKPVLNVFRMFGMMEGDRVAINQEELAYGFLDVRDHSVREKQDINAIASKSDQGAAVMIWNYHDNNDLTIPDASISLQIEGMPGKKILVQHFRIDQEHSNSYTLWKKMGSPQDPSNEQIEALEKAGQLEHYTSPFWVESKDGMVEIELTLPAQGISLFKLDWE